MKKIIILLTGILMSVSSAFASYNIEAKNNLSENDIYSFVYFWFANFDHQNDASVFTNHLDEKNINIQYPDYKIKSIADFINWYKNVEDNIYYNFHDIKEVSVKKLNNNQYQVNLLVNWKAQTYAKENLDVNIYQKWILQEKSKKLYLISLESSVKK